MKSGFSTQLIACRPRSSGRVRLRDSHHHTKPLLEDVYLSAEGDDDVKALREGIKLARKLVDTEAFDNFRGKEVYPGAAVRTNEQIDAYIRSSIHSANALTSSCRMGAASDPMAVLDPELRVRGVRGLRVVDASAMPQIIGGQTCAPTLMLAEKAADMILSKRAGASPSVHAVKLAANAV
jgi:choline dehydrogenase-like flavoprotein